MDSQIKTQLKRGAKYTGLTVIALGLIAMVYHVGDTMIKNDYIGGPTTTKVVVSSDELEGTVALNDKLSKPLKAVEDVKMTQIKLRNDRVIQLFGEVNEDSAKAIVKKIGEMNKSDLLLEEKRPITLVINSPGGSVIDGALIVDAMNGSKAPVNTLCIQLCASMAAMIHQYGKQRFVLPHGVLMFHPAAGGTYGDVDRMASELALFQRYVGSMELNAAKRAKISIQEYKNRSGVQLWLTGEESVKAGFADGVVYINGEETSKLFAPDPVSTETDKKSKTKKVKSAFKSFLIQVLGAGIQFINNADDNSPIETIRRDFNDVPVHNPVQNSPAEDLRSVK
jgi:ATP-dependent Clp protease, protease subunit